MFSIKNSLFNNLLTAIFLGLLSAFFGLVNFQIPGVDGATSGLNEVPLIISVIYVTNPIYLIISAAIGSIITPADGSIMGTFISHAFGLIFFWYYYFYLIKGKDYNNLKKGILFNAGIIIYYSVFVILILSITYVAFGIVDREISLVYYDWVKSSPFEIIATCLITTLYLFQHETTQKLKSHLEFVEELVKERTKELDQAIEELNSVNEELVTMNDSLDLKVRERTKELENKNVQLSGYAFVNSHLLRAPLARILGLSQVIRTELTSFEDHQMLEMFSKSCEELDEIVKLLSKYLSEESVLDKNQLSELQEKIRIISMELKEA